MLFFENDYGYGAHPKILEHLAQTNMEPVSGYGNDKFTASAAEKIKAAADCPDGVCVAQGAISSGGVPIICMPHHLSVRIEGDGIDA